MEWQRPEALYLILPLCAGWVILALESNRRRRLARQSFAAPAMWTRILPKESLLRFWFKLLLREVAIIAGLVALAGPRFGTEYEQVIPRGADLYVLIDVSRSMLADDVPPSRLGRAKADVSSLLNRLQGERVGLIAFAGQAVVKCPLTADYDSFRRSLDELDPDSAPKGGTAIGDAIRKGLEVFHANADRDQAMILITDGDDQESYPLEAAATANERHVTIFTIGLGDAERGARVPQKGDSKSFVEYQGQQVWSKLDNSLLEQIALKTSGVYVPAGTRSYDLGELYTNHLQGRKGHDDTVQQKIRRSEQFQIFLAIALAALLIDLCISPYIRSVKTVTREPDDASVPRDSDRTPGSKRSTQAVAVTSLLLAPLFCVELSAKEPAASVREGLRLYSKEQFEEARTEFAAAEEELEKQKRPSSAIAAFDEACAAHRKGDLEQARECYLRAGLSQDRAIAVAAHFNLGVLDTEKAKTLAGEKPELVPNDKRQEIIDQLLQAIAAYRHCLELQSDHVSSRRNIELIRQWIKHYQEQWRQRDLQKRRDESNLLQFLEFVMQTQSALKQSVSQLQEPIRSDTFAELKRAQEELHEEMPTLREKLETELLPKPDPTSGSAPAPSKELEEGIKLIQSWSDTAAEKMASAARRLAGKDTSKTITDQQAALEELDRIWEGVIPFQPLLANDVAAQTTISSTINPQISKSSEDKQADDNADKDRTLQSAPVAGSAEKEERATTPAVQELETEDLDFAQLEAMQSRTLRRTRLLVPKAESELQQLEKNPKAQNSQDKEPADPAPAAAGPQGIDPEQQKAGYLKAIELAPQAVEKMEAAIESLKKKDRQIAGQRAEEARRILEEIQKSQPKNQNQQQDQKNNDQQDKDQQNQQDQNPQEDQKNEDKKNQDQEQPDQQKKDQNKNDQQQKQDQKQQQQQVSQDRVEDALRKVRERQQEKRERDRKLKGLYLGKTPVDKDW